MRQTIARRMGESKQMIPHFYLVGDVQMRKALEKRQQLNASGELHITITDLIVRAVALALKAHPRMNARFDGNAIVFSPQINVGVAVAVADGLFVPVVKNADSKGIAQVSAELKSLAQAARAGKLIPEQYKGGSITISNLGTFGVDYFLPIINPPEACILGIGRVAEQPVVQEGAIRIEPVMKVALSADHRVVDGAEAAKFFQSFRELLEKPEQL
jgi:pyruvate dehydrogenase E2 component (dihydrolipoamide acetyltransferase)